MGHALMDKVMLHWSNLPGNAYKVLMIMAKSGMDDDLVPIYFGGWERLAMTGLGRRDWPSDDDDSPESERVRKATFETVRRAVNDAKDAGAVKIKRHGKRGSVAHYSLHLDAPNLWKTPELPKETLGSNPTKRWGKTNKTLGTPQRNVGVKKQGNQLETRGEISSSPAVPHQGARSTAAKARDVRLKLVRDRADAALEAGTA